MIAGVDAAEALDGVHVIHAGTAVVSTGSTDGAAGSTDESAGDGRGRVLAVIGTGAPIADARAAAYRGVAAVEFDGAQQRTDIARAKP